MFLEIQAQGRSRLCMIGLTPIIGPMLRAAKTATKGRKACKAMKDRKDRKVQAADLVQGGRKGIKV